MKTYYPSDYSVISFPHFGIEVDPSRFIQIGPFTIHWYGVIIAVGLMLAVIYGCRRSKHFGIREDDIVDGVLYVTPFAIVCARLYYCIFSWESGGYAANPISMLYIWEGGLAIYGGVLGAIVGVAVFCKVRKLKLAALLDLVLLGFLIGQSVGRWGNFMNREAFGEPVSESYLFAMGLFNTRTQAVEYFHPTFLYESAWNALGFVLLHLLSKHRKYDGQVALGYAAWYGLGRAVIEGLRVDSLYGGTIRVSQLLGIVSFLGASAALIFLALRPHDKSKLFVNRTAE